jgi:hypothetical protein
MPFGLILFGIVLGALWAVAGAVEVHRTKDRIHHLSTVQGLSIVLIFASAFFGQFILSFVLIFILGIFSYAMMPKVFKAREREMAKKLGETDASLPLTVRDLFADVFWVKLIGRWGLLKTLGLTYLAFLAGIAAVCWAISQFYTSITPTFIIAYAVAFSSLFVIFLYIHIRKVPYLHAYKSAGAAP